MLSNEGKILQNMYIFGPSLKHAGEEALSDTEKQLTLQRKAGTVKLRLLCEILADTTCLRG